MIRQVISAEAEEGMRRSEAVELQARAHAAAVSIQVGQHAMQAGYSAGAQMANHRLQAEQRAAQGRTRVEEYYQDQLRRAEQAAQERAPLFRTGAATLSWPLTGPLPAAAARGPAASRRSAMRPFSQSS